MSCGKPACGGARVKSAPKTPKVYQLPGQKKEVKISGKTYTLTLPK